MPDPCCSGSSGRSAWTAASWCFLRVMDHLPQHTFRRCVARYSRRSQGQTVRVQRAVPRVHGLRPADLPRQPLRDVETCLGGPRAPSSTTWASARRWRATRSPTPIRCATGRIYADFAQALIAIARRLYADAFGVDLAQTVYALDATTIDLSLSVFPWAHFKKTKGAIKLHTLLEHLRGPIRASSISATASCTTPTCLRPAAARGGRAPSTSSIAGAISTLHRTLITRLAGAGRGLLRDPRPRQYPPAPPLFSPGSTRAPAAAPACDQIVGGARWRLLRARLSRQAPAHQVSRPRPCQDLRLSHQQLCSAGPDHRPAVPLPLGQIELFFKWIKQHLARIQGVLRRVSENAVRTQIWIALSGLRPWSRSSRKRLCSSTSASTQFSRSSASPGTFERSPLPQILSGKDDIPQTRT